MSDIKNRCCVSCGGSNLCFGYLGTGKIGTISNAFVPSAVFTLHGYRTRSYVCIDCGYLGQYISPDKLEKLREKFKSGIDE